MYVGSEVVALRLASVPQLAAETPSVQLVHRWPPLTGGKTGGSTAVYHTTYSPVEARRAIGSCANTPATALTKVNGWVAGSWETAWMTLELDSHTFIPQPFTISAAYMCARPESSSTIDPPHDAVRPPPTESMAW
jgi:hypothetical protein